MSYPFKKLFVKMNASTSLYRLPLLLLLSFLVFSCSKDESNEPNGTDPTDIVTPPDDTEEENDMDIPGTIRDITSMELVAEMTVGWNLGNSLDVKSADKTEWGNPLPSQAIINKAYDMGFRTLRVPVSWNWDMQSTAPYTVDEDFMDLVQRTVNYGIIKDMHVIIDVHHDESWLRPTAADAPQAKERLAALWTQIANRFKNYGDKLIFETLNETRLVGSPEEWSGGTAEGRMIINEFHKTAIDAIRATGGNNAGRHVMISTYAASTVPAAMDDLVIPNNDPRTIVSLHTYFPWPFCGPDNSDAVWGTDQEKADLQAEFDRIYDKWVVQEGRPVILGEWGAVDKNNLDVREEYYEFYVSESTERGLLPIVWDDGGNFRMLDRANLTWHFPTLPQIIVASDN